MLKLIFQNLITILFIRSNLNLISSYHLELVVSQGLMDFHRYPGLRNKNKIQLYSPRLMKDPCNFFIELFQIDIPTTKRVWITVVPPQELVVNIYESQLPWAFSLSAKQKVLKV